MLSNEEFRLPPDARETLGGDALVDRLIVPKIREALAAVPEGREVLVTVRMRYRVPGEMDLLEGGS